MRVHYCRIFAMFKFCLVAVRIFGLRMPAMKAPTCPPLGTTCPGNSRGFWSLARCLTIAAIFALAAAAAIFVAIAAMRPGNAERCNETFGGMAPAEFCPHLTHVVEIWLMCICRCAPAVVFAIMCVLLLYLRWWQMSKIIAVGLAIEIQDV